jgi:hypothetical protein
MIPRRWAVVEPMRRGRMIRIMLAVLLPNPAAGLADFRSHPDTWSVPLSSPGNGWPSKRIEPSASPTARQ